MPAIQVLVVDDSAFMRQVITQMLTADPGIRVVGSARDGEDALVKLERLQPDVITLDLEMPKLSGLSCLAKIMGSKPLPVVVVSSWATAGAEQTLQALQLGAVDFVTKPVAAPSEAMWEIAAELTAKVKAAAQANPTPRPAEIPVPIPPAFLGCAAEASLCCLATSTGGPRALQTILTNLPADFPLGILLIQHMPLGFTRLLARHLAEASALPVKEADNGDTIKRGQILLAPSGLQTAVIGGPDDLRVRIGPNPPSVYRPSADVTFASIAEVCGSSALGVILTGMGQDGARGLLAMRKAGAMTVAEAAETCVVYGMPRAAAELQAAKLIAPLWQIPAVMQALTVPPAS